MSNGPLRVGIGGPVGAGKTTLTEQLCRALAQRCSMAVITNDIYTREDADYLTRAQALPAVRIRGVETGGCPHTAIREDASINLAAVADLTRAFPDLDLILIESGGDNLAATFSPELADLTIYVAVAPETAAQRLEARGGGRIINQTSGGAFPAIGVYGISKLALVGLTTTLAKQLGRDNIKVNAIAPGNVTSDAGKALVPDDSPFLQFLAAVDAMAGRLNADEFDVRLRNVVVEDAHRIAAAADTGGDHVGVGASGGVAELRARLVAAPVAVVVVEGLEAVQVVDELLVLSADAPFG